MSRPILTLFPKKEGKENMTMSGHNIQGLEEQIQELFVEYSKCDEISNEQNIRREELRCKAEELGLDRKAFNDEYRRAKRNSPNQEAYDQSAAVCREAMNKMNINELFEFVERQKEERKKVKQSFKKEEPEEEPAEDEKPVGQQQAEAVLENLDSEGEEAA